MNASKFKVTLKLFLHKEQDCYAITFYFNEKDNLFIESDGIEEIKLNDIRFSTTHILGYRLDEEILINRVSGTIIISRSGSRLTEGKCELLDKKKF